MKRLNRKHLFTIAVVFFAAVFVFSAFMLYREYAERKRSAEEFEAIAAMVETESPRQTESAEPENEDKTIEETEPAGPSAYDTYAVVYAENADFAGWISIEGTAIDYPVMHTPDDPDFYLKRGFDGEYSAHGVPYLQANCDISLSDNLIIYGHNMKDGSMFADLCEYADEDFFAEHKFIRFDTLSGFGEYEIIAVFKTVAYSEDGFEFYEFTGGDEAAFNAYVAECKELSLYDTGVTAEYGDKLITLSTCEYSRKNGRMVVVAKKISVSGEAAENG